MSDRFLRRFRLCVFDADDTLRRTTVPGRPCPRHSGEWALLPGVAETLRRVPWGTAGAPCFGIASNQDQVGYGLVSEGTALRLLEDLALAATGTIPPRPALQLCPHPADERCGCRKPAPGMLRRIMAHYEVAPAETLFVGNADTDREAAAVAGAHYADAAAVFRRSA